MLLKHGYRSSYVASCGEKELMALEHIALHIALYCQQITNQDIQSCRSLFISFLFYAGSKYDRLMIQLQIHSFPAAGTRRTL